MSKTHEIAENLVKMAKCLKYDDFDAKDKVLQYAGKLISEEFGADSQYMQKLGLIIFSPKESGVLGGMGAGESNLKRTMFENGVEKLTELLTQVLDELGGLDSIEGKVIVVQAKDKISLNRITAHIKAKGRDVVVIKDNEDWKTTLDKLFD